MILYPEKPERISKILSSCSICSRREAERLISEGRIALNGETVTEPGTKAVIASDKISLDGVVLNLIEDRENYGYYLLNKPCGYLTTCDDPFGRKTIFDLIELAGHYFPAGRLDLNSRGLVLITNDGLLCGLITHPRNMVEKKYMVSVSPRLEESDLKKIRAGIEFEGERYRARRIALDKELKNGGAVYEIILNEGKKREIRQMIKAVGARVNDLFRVSIANLSVSGIAEGSYRKVTPPELVELKKLTGYEKAQS